MHARRMDTVLCVWLLLGGSMFSLLSGCCLGGEPTVEALPTAKFWWEEIILPPDATFLHISRDAHWLIYSTSDPADLFHRTYWLANIEDGRLQDQVLIAEYAGEHPSRPLAFSPDCSWFLLQETIGRTDEIQLVSISNTAEKRSIYAGSSPVRGIVWAPDSRRVGIFTRDWGADLVNLDEPSTATALVPPGSFVSGLVHLSWSPTGEQIAYSAVRQWPAVTVWVTRVADGKRYPLYESDWPILPLWSPGGGFIVLLGFMSEGTQGIKVLDLEGTIQFERELEGWSWAYGVGKWSPDGERFAITFQRDGGAQQRYVGVLELPQGEWERLPINGGEGGEVVGWFPDGEAVIVQVFRDGVPVLVRVPVTR